MNKKTEKIINECLKRAEIGSEAWSAIYAEGRKDISFLAGNQWTESARLSRQNANPPQPCLVINKLPMFVNQIVNDFRQNKLAVSVRPVGDGADQVKSDIFKGIIKNIERNSDAGNARLQAFEGAVRQSIGFYRINTRYVSDTSFDQEIYAESIKDPFTVIFDPLSKRVDGSDAKWAIITTEITRDDYETQYPDKEIGEIQADITDQSKMQWIGDDFVRIAEYYVIKEENKRTVYQLPTGEVVEGADVPEFMPAQDGTQTPITIEELNSREVTDSVVHWYKLTGNAILEETVWAGKYIPVLPVYGQEMIVNGKRILRSAIRDAKDPARMYNYWTSTNVEQIALAPKAPFIGAKGQFSGVERQWQNANTKNSAYLEYEPVTVGDSIAPPPRRQEPAMINSAMLQATAGANDDIKATMGIYDASLGIKSNETSGRAIIARQQEGDVANFHFADNMSKTIKHEGRIYIDLIPKVMDTEQIVSIINDEDKEEFIRLNEQDEDGNILNDLSVGRYAIAVDAGASYQTQRQEAASSMLEFMKMYPQSQQVIGDLIAKNMDWPGAQEISDRLKKLMPANIIENDEEAVNQQLQEVTQQLQAIQEENAKLKEEADKNAAEIEKVRIQSETDITVAQIKAAPEGTIPPPDLSNDPDILNDPMYEQENSQGYSGYPGDQQMQNMEPQAPENILPGDEYQGQPEQFNPTQQGML